MSEYLDRKQFWSIEEAIDEVRGQCAGYSIKVLLEGRGHDKAIIAQMLNAGVRISVEAFPSLQERPKTWEYNVTVIK